MDVNVIRLFAIKILNCELNNILMENEYKKQLTNELLKGVYKLLKFHGLNHVLFNFVKKNKIEVSNEFIKILESDYLSTVLKSEKITYETNNVSSVLSDNGIKHVILKGEEIRAFYPKGFIRPSVDVDVLVEEKNLSKGLKILRNELEIVKEERNYHDVTIVLDSGLVVELHFTLSENDDRLDKITENYLYNLEKVCEFKYKFTNEFLIAYLITHTAYHFYNGGCGIKPIIDLYLLKYNLDYDESLVISYLEKGNLTLFYKKLLELVEVWFKGKDHTDTTLKLEEFILNGGAFGSFSQSKSVNDNKFKALLKKVFLPYKTLANYYPVLKKVCILYPIFIVVRCFKVLFSKEKQDRAKKQINTKVQNENKEKLNSLFKELNL